MKTHSSGFERTLILFCITIVMSVQFFGIPKVQAEDKQPRVLIVFSGATKEASENVRRLDMLIGHFTRSIVYKSSGEVSRDDFDNSDFIFYYGEAYEALPAELGQLFDQFRGPVVALGRNTEYLGKDFQFYKQTGEAVIDELTLTAGNKRKKVEKSEITAIKADPSAEVLIEGRYKGKTFPLFIKNDNRYFYSGVQLDSLFSIYLGEVLHEVFEADHPAQHRAYIRLEDIHPLTDPVALKGIADELKERDIPYILSVIPLYYNPDSKRYHSFLESPKLLSVLKYMQENGGSVIMHGYTHQYKNDETGEGFEFWDVDANMPITVPPEQTPQKKKRKDFKTDGEYLAFLAEQRAFEENYIRTKVNKAIEELVSHGLIPLGFEAPHYTMSQSGYEILSENFSSYIGQLQLGDRDWRIMGAPPYESSPSFLHGMKLFPETIGYVHPDDPHAIEKMMQAAEDLTVLRDSYIAGFYHPYLGVERFIELMDKMEKFPHLDWVDLKKESNTVEVNNISVQSGDDQVDVAVEYFGLLKEAPEFYKPKVASAANSALWALAVPAGLMVLLFIIYAAAIKLGRSRMERRNHG
jgi:uncharacterized protein YdaL